LDDIADRSNADLPAEVADDIGFGRRDHKTDAINTTGEHTFEQVFRNCPRTLNFSVATRTDRQQLFGER
jgi:hypothetical protein